MKLFLTLVLLPLAIAGRPPIYKELPPGHPMLFDYAQLARLLKQHDQFRAHLRDRVNASVKACNNFYRHVCPIDMSKGLIDSSGQLLDIFNKEKKVYEDPIVMSTNEVIKKIPAMKKNESAIEFSKSEWAEFLLNRCDRNYACVSKEFDALYEIRFLPEDKKDFYKNERTKRENGERKEILDKFYTPAIFEYMVGYARRTRNAELLAELDAFIVGEIDKDKFDRGNKFGSAEYISLTGRIARNEYLSKNWKKNDTIVESLKFADGLADDVKKTIGDIFNKTKWLNVPNQFGITYLDIYRVLLKQMTIHLDMDQEEQESSVFKNYLKQYNVDFYNMFSDLKNTTHDVLQLQISHIFAKHEMMNAMKAKNQQALYAKIQDESLWDAYRVGRNELQLAEHDVFINMGPLVSIIFNVTEAARTSALGQLMAHEVYHSFVDKMAEFLADATKYEKGKRCVVDHYSKTCKDFKEDDCNSGELTFIEDGPDILGAQAAYQLFRQRFGRKMNDLAYPDLPITNNQIFFYSIGILYCTEYWRSQHTQRAGKAFDDHSANYARVNGMFNEMDEFKDAFACKSGEKMTTETSDKCYIYGTEPREAAIAQLTGTKITVDQSKALKTLSKAVSG